jgi:hypothetical protein
MLGGTEESSVMKACYLVEIGNLHLSNISLVFRLQANLIGSNSIQILIISWPLIGSCLNLVYKCLDTFHGNLMQDHFSRPRAASVNVHSALYYKYSRCMFEPNWPYLVIRYVPQGNCYCRVFFSWYSVAAMHIFCSMVLSFDVSCSPV